MGGDGLANSDPLFSFRSEREVESHFFAKNPLGPSEGRGLVSRGNGAGRATLSATVTITSQNPAPNEGESAASRLCQACGLCCNGVMFHTVRLQPRDSAKALAALGLKLKRKQGQNYILQPCPAYRGGQCSIYLARPERCRMFECRQLKRLAAGETTEALAFEKIKDAQQRVERLIHLLQVCGKTDPKRPLSKRYEKIMAEPFGAESDSTRAAVRRDLTREMQELKELLEQDFRLSPVVADGAGDSLSGTLGPLDSPEPSCGHGLDSVRF